jgi:hypothetical protein
MVLLNGPPLSNFVDKGLGEWEWLGPGSIKFFFNILIPLMVLQNGTFEWHFVTHIWSLCVTRPKTYLLWFWLPPSFPIRSITLPFSLSFLSATFSLRSLFVTHSRSLCVTRLAQASGKTKSTRCASTCHSAWNLPFQESPRSRHGGFHSGLRPRAPTSLIIYFIMFSPIQLDLTYIVGQYAQFMVNLDPLYWAAIKWIFQYLKRTF